MSHEGDPDANKDFEKPKDGKLLTIIPSRVPLLGASVQDRGEEDHRAHQVRADHCPVLVTVKKHAGAGLGQDYHLTEVVHRGKPKFRISDLAHETRL